MNKRNTQKGITLVALVITIILMLILFGVVYKFSKDAIEKTKLEDIKTNMLLIKGKAKTFYDRFSFSEIDALPGVSYDPSGANPENYVISNRLKTKLQAEGGTYYILEEEDLEEYGLETIDMDNEKFYIVDYENGEVYYSLGYTNPENEQTYYSLTELQS